MHGLCPLTPQPCLALDHWILSKDQLKDSLSLESLDFSSTGSFPPTAVRPHWARREGLSLLLVTPHEMGF